MAILEIKNLSKHFGHVAALNNVTLSIRHGEITSLIGPNGAGKTTFHGVVNGLLLPHVMEYNIPVRTKELADVAKALGEKVEGLSLREAAFKAITAVNQIIRDICLSTRMRDIGVKEKDIRPMAEATMLVTRLLRSNPRRVSAESIEEIYKRAF